MSAWIIFFGLVSSAQAHVVEVSWKDVVGRISAINYDNEWVGYNARGRECQVYFEENEETSKVEISVLTKRGFRLSRTIELPNEERFTFDKADKMHSFRQVTQQIQNEFGVKINYLPRDQAQIHLSYSRHDGGAECTVEMYR